MSQAGKSTALLVPVRPTHLRMWPPTLSKIWCRDALGHVQVVHRRSCLLFFRRSVITGYAPSMRSGTLRYSTCIGVTMLVGKACFSHVYPVQQVQPLMGEVLRTTRAVLGDGHPDTLASLGYLAGLLSEQGTLASIRHCWFRWAQIHSKMEFKVHWSIPRRSSGDRIG